MNWTNLHLLNDIYKIIFSKRIEEWKLDKRMNTEVWLQQ